MKLGRYGRRKKLAQNVNADDFAAATEQIVRRLLRFFDGRGDLLKEYLPLINLLKKEVTNETINHRFSTADINSSLCFGSDEAKQLN